MFDQPPADHWSNSSGNRTETRPCANRASTLVFRKRAANDCETAWNEQGRAESLCCTCDNQLMYVGSEAAPRRRHSEQSDTNQENSAPSVMISERSTDEQKRCEQKRVSLDDPLHVDDRGVQVRLQRW